MTAPLFTPTTARDLHRNLIEWWGSVYAQQWAAALADVHGQRHPNDDIAGYFAVDPTTEQHRLRAAETFLVTDDMSAVCRHAAATLPTLAVDHGMPPAEIGFIVFNDRLTDHAAAVGALIPVEVIHWWPAVYDGTAGIAVATYASPETMAYAAGLIVSLSAEIDGEEVRLRHLQERLSLLKAGAEAPDRTVPERAGAHSTTAEVQARVERKAADQTETMNRYRVPMAPALFTFLPYGTEPPAVAVSDRETEYAVRMLLSAWLLMGQPIAAREHPRIARPAAKRAVRAGLLSDLTVVMLRQPKAAASDEPSGREYHRRWIVRGHWRRIPLPEQPSRVTWVHGYVKGPADAPLVMTDRVTVLAR